MFNQPANHQTAKGKSKNKYSIKESNMKKGEMMDT